MVGCSVEAYAGGEGCGDVLAGQLGGEGWLHDYRNSKALRGMETGVDSSDDDDDVVVEQ